ncbi:VOC family protein [Phenylobacterium terrae]|uniref:VOC family protein n=1 Tax=Phenylobacterium terrae TaxID=2665495 RepID=A0ABW4MZD2_9CAUL
MAAPVVSFDIAGPDLAAQRAFYSAVFDWEIAADGRFSVAAAAPLGATLRADPADKLIYLGVPDIAAALQAIAAHGGAVDAPRFEVPGVVVLGLFRDPAGNRMGLVEMGGEGPRIPFQRKGFGY